ncbi:hypothetical protein ABVT43_10130 [Aliikangiella sp. GXAS 311]
MADTIAHLELDKNFGVNGFASLNVSESDNKNQGATTSFEQADGKLLIAVNTIGGQLVLMRLLVDGSLDTSFNTTGKLYMTNADDVIAFSLQKLQDGKLLLGYLDYDQSKYRLLFNRFSMNGDFDKIALEYKVVSNLR